MYKLRAAVEGYFRSAKNSRLLNQHQYMGLAKVELHSNMARLAYLATTAAPLKADDVAKMRHMSVRLPKAQPQPTEPQVHRAIITTYAIQSATRFLRYMDRLEPV